MNCFELMVEFSDNIGIYPVQTFNSKFGNWDNNRTEKLKL